MVTLSVNEAMGNTDRFRVMRSILFLEQVNETTHMLLL